LKHSLDRALEIINIKRNFERFFAARSPQQNNVAYTIGQEIFRVSRSDLEYKATKLLQLGKDVNLEKVDVLLRVR
jgi:hypothetical protein